MNKSTTCIFGLAFLVLSACTSDLNLKPDTTFSYGGNWAAPIVHARLNLADLVNDSTIVADNEGLIHILYSNDSIYAFDAKEFTKVPDQDPIETILKTGSPNFMIGSNLGTLGGAKLKSMALADGQLSWSVNNPTNGTITVALEIADATQNGVPFIINLNAPSPGLNIGSISLADLNFDLTQGTPAYNNIKFEFAITNNGGAPNGTDIPVIIQLENLEIKNAIGYFGQRKVNLPSGRFATDLNVIGQMAQGLYLKNPQLKLYVTSNVGLKLALNPDIIGVNQKGASTNLGLGTYNFFGAPSIGSFGTDTFAIDANNSQIDDFVALVPSEMLYSGNIEMNPAGETQVDNFITNDSRLKIGISLDLPLQLKSKNVKLDQTIYNVDFGVDEGDYDFIESLTLGFRTENGFPLASELTAYFIDTNGIVTDSVNFSIFEAATVDANGRVIAPAKHDKFLTFTKQNIDAIMHSRDIRLVITLNTSGGGNQEVKILTDYYYDVIVGAQVKLNYKL